MACCWHMLCMCGQLVPVAYETCVPLSGFHKGQQGLQYEVKYHI